MLSQIPFDTAKIRADMAYSPGMYDSHLLRIGIIAELDAINLYEQLAVQAREDETKQLLLDVAKEEKTHVGEFLHLLLTLDLEQYNELERGKEEVRQLVDQLRRKRGG